MPALLPWLLSRLRKPERRNLVFGDYGLGPITATNYVNARLAENLSTVMACVGAISSTLATLPAYVYRQEEGGRSEARNHPVARLIRAPNDRQTWPDWLEMTLSQALLWGNAISIIEYDGAGRPTALIPVPWQNVQCFLLPTGRLAYDIVQFIAPWGGTGTPRRYLDGEVFHLKDRSDDGFLGRSRLSRAPEVLGAALGIQTYSAAIWRNGATPAGALKHPGRLGDEAITRIAQSFRDAYGGAHNARRTIVLEEGMEWVPFSVSPEDAEVLESRRFTVEELCRLYQVPPPIVQDYSHGTFTNTAQAALWFAQLTLTPWARKIETEFARTMFGEGSQDFHIEIDLSGLMRGDYTTRLQVGIEAVRAGILTANELREQEGYNPVPAGDALMPQAVGGAPGQPDAGVPNQPAAPPKTNGAGNGYANGATA